MSRLLLIHWNAEEAREKAARLRRGGHVVAVHSDTTDAAPLRKARGHPPDALVIDLARLPSHGRGVAAWFLEGKKTRGVPIVFIEGDREKTARVREVLPDAVFTTWPRVLPAIRRAIAHPPDAPVVPRPASGYSGTPLPKKLGIRAGSKVALLNAPEGFEATLGTLPEGAAAVAGGPADVVLLFVQAPPELSGGFPEATRALADGGKLWIVWPKKKPGASGGFGGHEIRAFALAAGWVDWKICAVDEVWSGLCFARRGGAPEAARG